jgi:RimJ/RimL family protein N-acetyltransferase
MSVTLPPRLDTDRLVLRESQPSDAAAIFAEYAQDSDATRFLVWRPHRSIAVTEAYLDICAAERAAGTSNTYMLVPREGGGPIGAFALRVETPHRLSFGYVLARRCWGRGLMPEALGAALRWAAGQPSIWRVWSFCDVDNTASARTMEKSGMAFEGVLRRWSVHPNLGPAPRDCRAYAWTRTEPAP